MRLAAVLALLVAAGCRPTPPKPVNLAERPREYRSKDYLRVLDRWSRSGRITKEFDMVLEAHSTFKSWDYRQAYVARFVQAYKITGRERDAMLERELGEARTHHEFFVSAATSRWEWNDFTKQGSIWRIKLIDDKQREVAPIEIKLVKQPDAHLQVFYRNAIQLFSKQYAIRFPQTLDNRPLLTQQTKFFTLRFAGPLGTLDLRWNTETGEPVDKGGTPDEE